MSGLEYSELLQFVREGEFRDKGFALEMGGSELDPVPVGTVQELAGRGQIAAALLSDCFNERPLLWCDLATTDSDKYAADLQAIESRLAAEYEQLSDSSSKPDRLLAAIVNYWLQLTRRARQESFALENSDGETATPRLAMLLAHYRAESYGPIDALLQLLTPADHAGAEAGRKLHDGKMQLVRSHGIDPDDVRYAAWHLRSLPTAAEDVEEPGVVTWGIP